MRTHKHCGNAALIGAEIWLRSSERVQKKKVAKREKKKVAGFKIINISVRKIVS